MVKLSYGPQAVMLGENLGEQLIKAAQASFYQKQEAEVQKWVAAGYKPQDLVLELYPYATEMSREGIVIRQNFKVRLKTDEEIGEETKQLEKHNRVRRGQARAFLNALCVFQDTPSALVGIINQNKETLQYLRDLLEEMDEPASQTKQMGEKGSVNIPINKGK